MLSLPRSLGNPEIPAGAASTGEPALSRRAVCMAPSPHLYESLKRATVFAPPVDRAPPAALRRSHAK